MVIQLRNYRFMFITLFLMIGLLINGPTCSGDTEQNEGETFEKLREFFRRTFGHRIFQEELSEKRFEKDLRLITGLGRIEDRIILLSIFERYYVKSIPRVSDPLRKKLTEFEKGLKKALLERATRHYVEEHGHVPDAVAVKQLEQQSLQQYASLEELSPSEALRRVKEAEVRYVRKAKSGKEQEQRRVFFEWALEKLRETRELLEGDARSFFKRYKKPLLLGTVAAAAIAAGYFGYPYVFPKQKILGGWESEPGKKNTSPGILAFFSDNFDRLVKAFKAKKKLSDQELSALSQAVNNRNIIKIEKAEGLEGAEKKPTQEQIVQTIVEIKADITNLTEKDIEKIQKVVFEATESLLKQEDAVTSGLKAETVTIKEEAILSNQKMFIKPLLEQAFGKEVAELHYPTEKPKK